MIHIFFAMLICHNLEFLYNINIIRIIGCRALRIYYNTLLRKNILRNILSVYHIQRLLTGVCGHIIPVS